MPRRRGHGSLPAVQYAFSISSKKSAPARFVSELPSRFTISTACLLLILLFAGLEAMHVHSGPGVAQNSSTSCQICISAHSNAPAVTVSFIAVLLAVEIIAFLPEIESKDVARSLELFSRPPPSA